MWMLPQGFLIFLCYEMQFVNASSRFGLNDTSCKWNVSTPKLYIEKIPSAFLSLQDGHSLSFSFSVTACTDAGIILSSGELPYTAGSYEIVIGGGGNKRSEIYRFSRDREKVNETFHRPLSCTEPRSFYVSWKNQVLKVGQVDKSGGSVTPSAGSYLGTEEAAETSVKVNGRWQTQFLTYRETSWNTPIRHVFVNNNDWGSGAKWQIDVPCESQTTPPPSQTQNPTDSPATEDTETAPLPTNSPDTGDDKTEAVNRQGLFTIPVIGAVAGGLAAGACVMYTGLRLRRKCREKTPTQRKRGEVGNIELIEFDHEQLGAENEAETSVKYVPIQKSAEANTDYISMSGASAQRSSAKHSDDVTPRDAQKPFSVNVSSRAMSPLSQVPSLSAKTSQYGTHESHTGKLTSLGKGNEGTWKGKEAGPSSGLYANENVPSDNVYEEVRGDLPVYINAGANI